MPCFVAKKQSSNQLCEKVPKTVKKPQKCNLAHNFKRKTMVFNSNHFNTIIYTKLFGVPNFMANKHSLNYIMRESAKKA